MLMEHSLRRASRRFSGALVRRLGVGILLGAVVVQAAPPDKKVEAEKKPVAAASDTVIATYEGGQVTLGEIQAMLDRQASRYLSRQLQTPEGRRRYVERIVQNRILADEARRRGIDKEPEIRARIDGLLAAELIQRLRKERQNVAVTDEEARKYYEEHKQEFSRPARKRISRILLQAKTPAEMEKKAKVAKELLAKIQKAGPKKLQVFHQLVREYSDDAFGKRRGGYYGLISAETKPSARYPKEVLDAVAKLQRPGDVSDVIKTPEGLQILMLEGEIPAYSQSVEQALPLIKARLRARRLGDVKTLAADILEKAHLTINEEALSQLRVSPIRTPKPVRPLKPKVLPPVRKVVPQPPPAPKAPARENAQNKKQ